MTEPANDCEGRPVKVGDHVTLAGKVVVVTGPFIGIQPPNAGTDSTWFCTVPAQATQKRDDGPVNEGPTLPITLP